MKTIKIFLTLITLLLLSVSCDEFLAEETRGIIEPSNFYNSNEEAILAINGVYNGFTGESFGAPDLYASWWGIQFWTVYGADDVGPGWAQGLIQPIQGYTLTESNYGNARVTWRNLYAIIGDANSVIENVEGNSNISENIRRRIIGEAIFLRSFAYYHLTNIWGAVPYYDENLTITEVAELGRTDADEIRSKVIANLTELENSDLLPTVYQGDDVGRATIWAAKMLKAKLMMWLEDWNGVLTETQEIINNSEHQLLENYSDVFDLNNSNPFNDEVIFGFDYSSDVPGGNTNVTDGFNPRIRDEPADPSLKSALEAELNANQESFSGFGLTVVLPKFAEEFPDDDLRKPLNVKKEYSGIELNNIYMPKKWNLDFQNSPRGNHGELYIVFRLADTYLMAAEAANELNNPIAYEYINRVRERAYEPDMPYSGLSQSEFRKALQDERRWELAAEGFRRYDLIRWGILIETVRNQEYPVFNGPDNILPIHMKAPIPQEELILNPNLLDFDPTNNGYR